MYQLCNADLRLDVLILFSSSELLRHCSILPQAWYIQVITIVQDAPPRGKDITDVWADWRKYNNAVVRVIYPSSTLLVEWSVSSILWKWSILENLMERQRLLVVTRKGSFCAFLLLFCYLKVKGPDPLSELLQAVKHMWFTVNCMELGNTMILVLLNY